MFSDIWYKLDDEFWCSERELTHNIFQWTETQILKTGYVIFYNHCTYIKLYSCSLAHSSMTAVYNMFVRSFCLCKFKLRLPSQWKHIYRSSSFHLLSSAGWSISKYMLKRQLFGILVCVSVNICLLWHESDQSKCLLSHYPEWHPIITS